MGNRVRVGVGVSRLVRLGLETIGLGHLSTVVAVVLRCFAVSCVLVTETRTAQDGRRSHLSKRMVRILVMRDAEDYQFVVRLAHITTAKPRYLDLCRPAHVAAYRLVNRFMLISGRREPASPGCAACIFRGLPALPTRQLSYEH